uniref:CBS domain-containing protein n=1 Tax=Aegilops tauschii subsp. strangulata TaxID=200361 RepID=A0A453JQK7_AEGTS
MQGIAKALSQHGKQLRLAVLQHMNKGIFSWATLISRIQSESPAVIIPHMGLENITVREILRAKGEAQSRAVYWCSTTHLVHEAVKHMTANNVGSLVVLKSGDDKQLAGIVTERGKPQISSQFKGFLERKKKKSVTIYPHLIQISLGRSSYPGDPRRKQELKIS